MANLHKGSFIPYLESIGEKCDTDLITNTGCDIINNVTIHWSTWIPLLWNSEKVMNKTKQK